MNHTEYYIDIHTHILPGIDDGSESMEQTVEMLRIAAKEQIRTIIATPHYVAGAHNPTVEKLRGIREQVQQEATKLFGDFNLLLGNELYYSESIIEELKSGRALTLADSNYVLVEFSVNADYQTLYRGIRELLRSGYAPILAHMERYYCLHKREDLIRELIKLGCYIQMNCNSLIGGMLNSEATRNRKMLNKGLVHFLGSDCHSDRMRAPVMETAVKYLQKKCDDRQIEEIVIDNPLKILENTYI